MSFEYDAVRGIFLFLAGLAVAAVGLRLLLKWRHATMLARARRVCARLKAPATTLSAVEDRAAAVEELIEFPDSRAAAAAVREVLGEHDDTIRSAAIEVLRQTRALDRWRRDLRRGNFKAKLRAIEALGEVGDERAVEELLEALGDDDPDIARAASRAVCARDVDYACERLADALASPSRRLAETAAAALVHMGDGSVEYLVGRLASLDPQARRLAAESLGSIGGEKLRDVLLPLLSIDPDPEVRVAVAAALARVDGPSAVAEIQRLARYDPDWFVRARAYSLLAEVGAEGATQHLLDGLAAFEPSVAQLAENGHNVESYLQGSRRVRRAIVAGLRLLGLSDDEIATAERGAEVG
jgi:HEAT repeat protein